MVHSNSWKTLLRAGVLLVALALGAVQAYCQKTISYQTEDGWTIYGSFYLPEGTAAGPAPVVLMLTDPGWDVRSNYNVLALPLMKRGFAALSIDVRGAGQSARGKHLGEVSLEDQTKLQLDIKGAVKFLASQKEIDAHRIAIVGTGVTAGYAAMEASDDPAIQALVFISGNIPAAAKSVIGSREDMPVLCIAE
jgi:dienelactone hydrolase